MPGRLRALIVCLVVTRCVAAYRWWIAAIFGATCGGGERGIYVDMASGITNFAGYSATDHSSEAKCGPLSGPAY
jgi:hypothetical protein